MFSRSILGACALVLATGCVTHSRNDINDTTIPQEYKNKFCSAKKKEETRAAFDFGSSGIKMKIACVKQKDSKNNDIVRSIITKQIFSEKIDVSFGNDLVENSSGVIPKSTLDNGKMALEQFCEIAKMVGVTDYRGAGTYAFREAKNKVEPLTTVLTACPAINKAKTVTYEEEGKLEFISVLASLRNESELLGQAQPVVLGIGSNSVQISYLDTTKKKELDNLVVVDGGSGSERFWSRFPESKNKCEGNPLHKLSATVRTNQKETRKDHIMEKVSEPIRELIEESTVFGLGGSLGHLPARTKDENGIVYMAKLEAALSDSLNKCDPDIASELGLKGDVYKSTLTNMVLIEGILSGLHAKKVELIDTGVTDGLLVAEDWPPTP